MATEFGKQLRRLRIDNDELLKTMAERLGIASSTLSSIEAGRRSPSRKFVESVISEYRLSTDGSEALWDAFERSSGEVSLAIKNMTEGDQRLAVSFARRFAELSDAQKRDIRRILEED